jgi:putative colanic acid biosynthesis acetyltransferase WcaF
MGFARFHPTCRVWAPWELHVGNHVTIDANVNLYNAFGIRMGDRVVVSLNSFLCTATHDYSDPAYRLTGAPIVVGDDCWIAADVFVHPGVKIKSGSVVGARAVVNRDVEPWTVVAGHPAKFVKARKLKDPSAVPADAADKTVVGRAGVTAPTEPPSSV